MSKNEATPRPWSYESAVNDAYILFDEAETRTIGLVGEIEHSNSADIPQKQYHANADLIVRAVNAHDGMLAALRAVEWTTTAGICPSCDVMRCENIGHAHNCQLDAAIATATEGAPA